MLKKPEVLYDDKQIQGQPIHLSLFRNDLLCLTNKRPKEYTNDSGVTPETYSCYSLSSNLMSQNKKFYSTHINPLRCTDLANFFSLSNFNTRSLLCTMKWTMRENLYIWEWLFAEKDRSTLLQEIGHFFCWCSSGEKWTDNRLEPLLLG